MIKAVRETTIKQAENANPQAGTHTRSETFLIIAVSDKSEHYHKFDTLLDELKIETEEKVNYE